ncbi:hypothetical protein SynNOUM97013_01306 [Synechococcus sp. NOUM97013]|nr:hypothetical protein SynNOUM97013_01306 [Synechococcus sp. NOUM97013]
MTRFGSVSGLTFCSARGHRRLVRFLRLFGFCLRVSEACGWSLWLDDGVKSADQLCLLWS